MSEYFDIGLDLLEVLTSLKHNSNRIKVLRVFQEDGYEIKESDIKDYFCFEGDDIVLHEMMRLYQGTFSKETIMDFCTMGTDIHFYEIIKRVEGNIFFKHDEVLDILISLKDDDMLSHKAVFEIFNPKRINAEMLRDILNIIPVEAYIYVEKYLEQLPPDEGLSIWQEYFQEWKK